jgi:hypothetical protein
MAQYQITVDQDLLHRLFLGNNRDSDCVKYSSQFPIETPLD